jgi:hypothetical protein
MPLNIPTPKHPRRTRGVEVKNDDERRQVFVAYPWAVYGQQEYRAVYEALEKPLAVKFLFAEDRIESVHVLDKIKKMIGEANFGIYDVTDWNPNVTLEYGLATGMETSAFIAFNPARTTRVADVPTDVRGYDRLQYTTLDELGDKVATVVAQQLGSGPRPSDPLEEDRLKLLSTIRANPNRTASELATLTGHRKDYLRLLLARSQEEVMTTGATKGTRYRLK